jgi:dihydroflavonol-4-reductase
MECPIDPGEDLGLVDELFGGGMAALVAARIIESKGEQMGDIATRSESMRVMVTGATGFLGCHTVAALVDAGHAIRALVRSPERAQIALGAVGVPAGAVEMAVGDVADPVAVGEALDGCDAVVHAAAVVAFDPRKATAAFRANVGAGEIVLGTARRLGLDPIVHVSGVPALLPCRDAVLTPDAPLGDPPRGYVRSKVVLEELARGMQEDGVPVVIFQPGLMLGPHDPKLGMGTRMVRDVRAGKVPAVPAAGLPLGDVRDVAAAIVQAIAPGRGPRRYMVGGTYTPFTDLVEIVADVAGTPISVKVVRPGLMLAVARCADAVQRVVPWQLPITATEAWVASHDPHTDDSRARAELGFEPRELRTTIADTIGWLAAEGEVAAAPGPAELACAS